MKRRTEVSNSIVTKSHRHRILGLLAVLLFAVCWTTGSFGEEEGALSPVPDVRIVGWTIGDGITGNGDGGLHPGETATLEIYLSNQGTEPAHDVIGQLFEAVDHPDVRIVDKLGTWDDLPATGEPKSTHAPHFGIEVQATRPCGWEIPLRLEIDASNGYQVAREFTIEMVDPRVTDLAAGAGRPFVFGADPEDDLGRVIASGDLDGDGADEVIMGAPSADSLLNARPLAGEVAIAFDPLPIDLDLAAPSSGGVVFVYGAELGDRLGGSVAAGDLDGDGFDDLILGAPWGDGPGNGRDSAGEVAIVYAGGITADIDLALPPFNVSFVHGADAGDYLGTSVAAGDLDGDGFDDLILGAHWGNGPAGTRTDAGEVFIIYGGPVRLPWIDLASPPSWISIVYGATAGDTIGGEVAAGDLDGDGFDDLILGAKGGDGPNGLRGSAGQVVVLWGDETRLPASVDLASPPEGALVVHGADYDDHLGSALATGDLDGDGFEEFIVGAYQADGPDDTRDLTGEVVVIYGSSTRPAGPYIDLAVSVPGVSFIYGADANDELGLDVAAGDLDGDGYDDLAVGVAEADGPANGRSGAGEAAVIYGSPSRWGDIDLASSPASVLIVHGADNGDYLGRALELSDLDGDGLDDLILGAYSADGFDNSRMSSGEVAIIPGAPRHNYRFDPDAYAFIDASIGTDLGLACDDCGMTTPIGFDFNYFGQRYDSLTVSSNGYLTFDGPGDRLPVPVHCPPRATAPNNLVAVWWDDWDLSAGGAVYALLEGTAPNRRFTIEWAAVPNFCGTGDATFEVTLFESSDQIVVQYQDTTVGCGQDAGASGIIGLENSTGTTGVTALCFSPDLSDSLAARFRRYSGPTVVYSEDVEGGPAGWTATGLWHEVTYPTCFPSSRSGTTSWYYGQDLSCDYDTGAANTGSLTSPVIPGLPQDAALSFWLRREVEVATSSYDQTFVEVQADGGGFNDIRQLTTPNYGNWQFTDDVLPALPNDDLFTPLDLSPFVGQDVELRFRFDTVDDGLNDYLGWMIDDITIRACPVYGAVAAAEALATAQPPAICETDPGRVDALGSYCAACGVPLSYQWKEDGVPIGGATGVSYDIPAGHAPGSFDYTVEIACPTITGCGDESEPAAVDVVAAPVAVGSTMVVSLEGGADMRFNWTDVFGASDYLLYSSTDPSVTFTNTVGSAVSGSVGLTIAVPGPPLVYYLVAGHNPVCGVGPQR